MEQIELPWLTPAASTPSIALGAAAAERFAIAHDPQVDIALMGHAPVYIGISGGKDSQALAYRVQAHLDTIGHAGSRALIYSDLGRVEWRDSISVCERLAERLGWALIVVRRAAGGMMDRWLSRWEANVGRYAALSCVKLIMPWSSAVARFCTSDQKSSVIARAIRARHPSGTVISAVGIRREESTAHARAPAAKRDERLTRACDIGIAWNPLILWSRADVPDYIRSRGDVLHMAYRIYGSSRVSCAFCVLASQGDLLAATRFEDNAAIYREMVDLEIRSTFSFQSKRWPGDVAPALLDAPTLAALAALAALAEAKERAMQRQAAEPEIPAHLLYEAGWPVCMRHLRRRGSSRWCAAGWPKPWASASTAWKARWSAPAMLR